MNTDLLERICGHFNGARVSGGTPRQKEMAARLCELYPDAVITAPYSITLPRGGRRKTKEVDALVETAEECLLFEFKASGDAANHVHTHTFQNYLTAAQLVSFSRGKPARVLIVKPDEQKKLDKMSLTKDARAIGIDVLSAQTLWPVNQFQENFWGHVGHRLLSELEGDSLVPGEFTAALAKALA